VSYQQRKTFVIPDGREAIRDTNGRATGETRPIPTKSYDSIARAYVERTPLEEVAMESFGVLCPRTGDGVDPLRWREVLRGRGEIVINDNLRRTVASATERMLPVETGGCAPPVYVTADARTPRADRKAAYVLAYSGRFYPFDPKPEDV